MVCECKMVQDLNACCACVYVYYDVYAWLFQVLVGVREREREEYGKPSVAILKHTFVRVKT